MGQWQVVSPLPAQNRDEKLCPSHPSCHHEIQILNHSEHSPGESRVDVAVHIVEMVFRPRFVRVL